MIGATRRDLLVGAACLAAGGGAYALKPRRNVTLLGEDELADVVPPTFGAWVSEDVGDPLAINGPGTLSAKLYNQLLVRNYRNDATGTSVLMLLAYGGRQTDELQLHRPEICYPAFGFELLRNEPTELVLTRNVEVPARRLIADNGQRRESVVYWSRMGEFLPASAGEQREARLKTAMSGIIPDGLLCRFSATPADRRDDWAEINGFVPQLVAAITPKFRKVLIGTERASLMPVKVAAVR